MIFVTGGTGMLGSYLLLELLKKGKKVRASKRINSSLKITKRIFQVFSNQSEVLFAKIEWVDVDLFNQEAIEEQLVNVSEIYHCAAQINNLSNNKELQIFNNIEITKTLSMQPSTKVCLNFVM
jgi:nucleoside-diphosphate-sugar epimerase